MNKRKIIYNILFFNHCLFLFLVYQKHRHLLTFWFSFAMIKCLILFVCLGFFVNVAHVLKFCAVSMCS